MTITQVQYACEIARRGSMTRAAEQFYISQPALSEQIKALEAELGCVLFRRSAHGTELTETGKRFCKYAEPVVSAWKTLRRAEKQTPQPCAYRLRGAGQVQRAL